MWRLRRWARCCRFAACARKLWTLQQARLPQLPAALPNLFALLCSVRISDLEHCLLACHGQGSMDKARATTLQHGLRGVRSLDSASACSNRQQGKRNKRLVHLPRATCT